MLTRLTLAMALTCGIARAGEAVVSCDTSSRVDIIRPGMISVVGKNGNPVSVKINHQVEGGKFSPDGKYLVLYGQPLKVEPRNAQVTFLTLYAFGGGTKKGFARTYGAGIYSADFSADGKYLVVSSVSAIDVLDIASKNFEAHDPTYVPSFSMDACNKH
ncbi:hypothetical protein [Paraburkholderia guartelaensis]|nr:hypothetical protein [Paraburkholderia guartelaensis]